MKPFLFSDTIIETPTYYALYLLAFLAAVLLGTRRAKAYGLAPVRAVDLGMICFVSGVAGARLFHILFEIPGYYLTNPLRILYLWQGGFVLYGGLIVAFMASVWMLRRWEEPVARWADAVAPAVLLGVGVGRIGCLAAGCCYGSVTDWWWGIVFTHPAATAPQYVVLHPTQFLESIFGFLACLVLLIFSRRPPFREGMVFASAILAYASFRFLIEFIRGDGARGLYFDGSLSTSQLISIFVILGVLFWMLFWKKPPNRPALIGPA